MPRSYVPRHAAPTSPHPTRRRTLVISLGLAILGALGTGAAVADTDFGPGNSSGVGPQAPNARCHGDPKLFGPECKE
jgi:hypothetical protein